MPLLLKSKRRGLLLQYRWIYSYLYFKTKMGMAGLMLSHTLLISKIYTIFKDVLMMLKWFFYISTGFRFQRSVWECSVHICSCPWASVLYQFYLISYFRNNNWNNTCRMCWRCYFNAQSKKWRKRTKEKGGRKPKNSRRKSKSQDGKG